MSKIVYISFLFLILFIFLITPIIVNAGTYGTKTYSKGSFQVGEPEPSSPASSSSSAGGGGGATSSGGTIRTAIIGKKSFTLDKESIKIVLKQGQTKEETFTIKNTGDLALAISVDLKSLKDFIMSPSLDSSDILLEPKEEKTIVLVFKAAENQEPNVYLSEIHVKEATIEKIINTVVEVDSSKPVFDINIQVLSQSKIVFPGDELSFEINLINLRNSGKVNIWAEYAIKDFKGNSIATKYENLSVDMQAKFRRTLLVPRDLKPGTYVVTVKVAYGDSIGTSSSLFEVTAKSIKLYLVQIKDYRFILLFGAVVMIVGIFIFSVYQFGYFKKKVPKVKREEIKQLKIEEKAQKLKKELNALEKAYKSGFISEESYKRDKQRIEKELNLFKYK